MHVNKQAKELIRNVQKELPDVAYDLLYAKRHIRILFRLGKRQSNAYLHRGGPHPSYRADLNCLKRVVRELRGES